MDQALIMPIYLNKFYMQVFVITYQLKNHIIHSSSLLEKRNAGCWKTNLAMENLAFVFVDFISFIVVSY